MAGRLDVDGILAELSVEQLREWEAYAILEPFGAPWKQTALLAMLLANANRDPDAKPEPYEMSDFLPAESNVLVVDGESEPEEEEPHWMKMKRVLQVLADAKKENRS